MLGRIIAWKNHSSKPVVCQNIARNVFLVLISTFPVYSLLLISKSSRNFPFFQALDKTKTDKCFSSSSFSFFFSFFFFFFVFHRLTVVYVWFCSMIKGIIPSIRVLCFVAINSVLLNLLCVWIQSSKSAFVLLQF